MRYENINKLQTAFPRNEIFQGSGMHKVPFNILKLTRSLDLSPFQFICKAIFSKQNCFILPYRLLECFGLVWNIFQIVRNLSGLDSIFETHLFPEVIMPRRTYCTACILQYDLSDIH